MSSFLDQLGDDLWRETRRLTIQGAAELANSLFNGSSYVPYGEGQFIRGTQQEHQQVRPDQQVEPPDVERGGMEM